MFFEDFCCISDRMHVEFMEIDRISIVHQSMSMNSVVLHSLDFCSMDKMVGGYLGRLRFCSPFDGLSGFVAVDLRCCMLRQAAGWVLPLAILKDILSKVFYFKSGSLIACIPFLFI